MKKICIILLMMAFGPGDTVYGQEPPPGGGRPNQQNMEALRIAFMTKQLELTPDEAKKFWPVHDAYQGEIEKLIRENRQKKGDELELEEKLLGVRKKYKPEFVKAIGEEKFNKMLRVEREFRDMIRKELDRRKGAAPPGRPMERSRQ
ncbi:MAG TPA: hypothetical protein VK907_01945 [Phnomibacter sp.]|nr:hypothetical protein [Phnomibacter sp.]